MVCPYNGILFSNRRNTVLICTTAWMNLENIMLRGISQIQKVTSCVIQLTGKSIETESRLVSGEGAVTANGYTISLGER